MSNLANYSPYNKSYKFILFQNQAYHERNKRNASPVVKTNLKYLSQSVYINPEKQDNHEDSTQRCDSPSSRMTRSVIFKNNSQQQMAESFIDKQKRIIHRHLSYQKFRSQKISRDNTKLVKRLIEVPCQVINIERTEHHFEKHKKYREIRKRYHESGDRKDTMPLGVHKHLCPTLMEFHKTGLGPKFIEKDLAMSKAPSTARSLRRSLNRYQNQSVGQLNLP